MRIKKVLRYYADCGKGFWKKETCISHEENCMCWTNPKNKTCKTCKFGRYLGFDDETGDGGYFECENFDNDGEHTGAPRDIKYISVNCSYYFEDK